jgi:UDP-N-acetylglucosamine 2-epimerase (non-hydrolysing)
MREVLDANRAGIATSDVLSRLGLVPKRYLVVSMHRAENVDPPQNLCRLLQMLNGLCTTFDMPVIVSTHPRTRQRLENVLPAEALREVSADRSAAPSGEALAARLTSDPRIRFLKPFGFHDYLRLQQEAFCTLSDSGTISEESAILGFPAVTTRNSSERPEAMDSGHIVLTGLDPSTILRAVALATASADFDRTQPIPREYEVTNTSTRVVKLILGTAGLSHLWDGIVAAA